MRQVVGPLIGRARAFAFVLPGIGGITAGGAATGVRVVISAEWLRAMEHLIAIGAISAVEIAHIVGVPSLAVVAPARARPALALREIEAPPPGPAVAQRPVRVLVQHRVGNRQVEVNGQRWHLPRDRSPKDIPTSDPVGDRLQAQVDKIARTWDPSKLSRKEKIAIDNARAAGEPWRAKLLERQDLSAAKLHGCRFINTDLSTLRLPLWPFFTVCDPEEVQEQALKLPWPGQSRIIAEIWDEEPPKTVAITYDARRICKEDGATEPELKAVLTQLPGVIM